MAFWLLLMISSSLSCSCLSCLLFDRLDRADEFIDPAAAFVFCPEKKPVTNHRRSIETATEGMLYFTVISRSSITEALPHNNFSYYTFGTRGDARGNLAQFILSIFDA